MDVAIHYLNRAPLAGLMLVVMLGFLLGRPAWRGMSLGPAGGTLFVALLLGHIGLDLDRLYGSAEPTITVGSFGFALFIYSVGFEAGPRFFASVFTAQGWKVVLVGVLVNLLAVAVVAVFGALVSLDPSTAAGVFAGALTSAPAFAAASEVAPDLGRLSVAFALTYPFGLVGLVLLIQTLPRLWRQDLSRGAEAEAEIVDEAGLTQVIRRPRSGQPELTRAFQVARPEVCGRPLKLLNLTHRTGCFISRIHRGAEILIPGAETELQPDDRLLATGRLDELQIFEGMVGPEIYDGELRDRLPPARRVHVANREVLGKSLRELNIIGRHRCLIMRIERGHEFIEPTAEVTLQRDDIVDVVGQRDTVREVAKELGRFEASTQETDIAIYAGGILFGLLLGGVHLQSVGLDFSLGTAGGLLLVGLLLGRFRQIGPIRAHVPRAARQLVRDLGILLFVAETGVRAGGRVMEGLRDGVWKTMLGGALATLLPVLGAVLAGRWLLRMRPLDTWGSVAGGMTSSAALVAVKRAADSNEPAVSYAAAYAVASVLVAIAGHALVLLMT